MIVFGIEVLEDGVVGDALDSDFDESVEKAIGQALPVGGLSFLEDYDRPESG